MSLSLLDIWGGLEAAMNVLRTSTASDEGLPRNKFILLLTDGQPSTSPPRGHIPELHSYFERFPAFKFQLNTFGFGYNLDSQLLLDLATEGNGSFAFIPDAQIVGTCFVSSVANALASWTSSITVHVSSDHFAGKVLQDNHGHKTRYG